MVNVLDCVFVVSEFEPSRAIMFSFGMNLFILPHRYGLHSCPTVPLRGWLQYWITQVDFPLKQINLIKNTHKSWQYVGIYQSLQPWNPVGWGCRIHRLHLCKRVRPPPERVSWIWHLTIWWWGSSFRDLRNMLFIASGRRCTLAWSGST